jgi:hypothetical protein
MKLNDIKKLVEESAPVEAVCLAQATFAGILAGIHGAHDVRVPVPLADRFETYCDSKHWPCCRTHWSDTHVTFAVAPTYSELLAFEARR